ncbi:MAG: glycosyltransferase [Candidatus Aminicenantes bacterium]|nr:glycosyltransferase [Candidatus Aminicenantes bacterium]MDH5386025.1 glycosyltransferase [Candidatus Aminicenantes bacterium]
MGGIIESVFQVVTGIILVYFFLINSLYLLFIILSIFGIYQYKNLSAFVNFKEVFQMPLVKPISIIAPAYNEEMGIIESVKSLLALEYPFYEVIVVNDGSTDHTLEKLKKTFGLKKSKRVFRKTIETKPIKGIYISPSDPKLVVVDKVNGKKADAMNAGLNVSRYPLFCGIDSDSILEKNALLKMARPFLEDPEKTVGAGGIVRLSNGCKVKFGQIVEVGLPRNALARFQILEYLRAFLGGRIGLSMLKSILIISGAFGLFRKDIALQCGGYRTATIGEDMDLVVRIRKYLHESKIPFVFRFIPDPICWTEAPETLKGLANQRNRWHRGLIESLLHSKKMIFNPRYGITGLFAMPFYVIFEMLGPLIEVAGYVIFSVYVLLGQFNQTFAVLFFLLAVVLGILLSLLAILLEEYSARRYPRLMDIIIIVAFGLLENIVYRQYLAVIRAMAFLDIAKGKKEWGETKKKGFSWESQKQ